MAGNGNDEFLFSVRNVLDQYSGTPVTIRQLYYRLVAGGVIPNNINSYKRLVDRLSKWRKEHLLPMDAFVDRTRALIKHDYGWHNNDPKAWLADVLNNLLKSFTTYNLNKWYGQDYRVIVAVEKQALEGVFDPVCNDLGVDLAVCRGYPSLSFLSEIAQKMDYVSRGQTESVEDVILYFGDYDPSGINIPEALEDNLSNVFKASFHLERIALLDEHIDNMDLIPAPVKTTDSRANKFIENHGTDVYELDAVEPKDLQAMIRDAILQYMDEDALERRVKAVEEGREAIRKLMEENDIDGMLESIREVKRKLEGEE
jgi:hypothetical protein